MRKMYSQVPAVTGALNLRKREQTLGFLEEKPTVYGLQIIRGNVIGHNEIVQYAAKACNAPTNDVDTALNALLDAITYFTANGHGVQVDGLGTFKMVANAKCAKTLEECTTETLRKTKVRFFASQQMQQLCSLKNVHTRLITFGKSDELTPTPPEP